MKTVYRALLLGVCFAASPVQSIAQDNPIETPEPLFRRVAVPGPDHVGPRINIQIEPRTEAEEPLEPDDPPVQIADGPSGWFWGIVPTSLEAVGRTQAALRHLSVAPETQDLPIARLEQLNAMAALYGRDILAATVGTDVSPALVLAVIAVESSGRPQAVSGAGAQGLMQLIPATADRFGVGDVFQPDENIAGGVAYLDWLLNEFDQDPILALAGYNAGEGAVWSNDGVPNYSETRNYIPKVLATWQIARGLCLNPPTLLSDGCVFASMRES
ncbi:MAG: lytic transglycosylase domain-containing protein [Pseudomonadota bacterium]